jgi:hypothetical protein
LGSLFVVLFIAAGLVFLIAIIAVFLLVSAVADAVGGHVDTVYEDLEEL